MRPSIYALVSLACFAAGAYAWRLKSVVVAGPMTPPAAAGGVPVAPILPGAVETTAAVVEVGKERITQDDIDWEYNLVTEGVFDKDSLTMVPDLGGRYHQELQSLRRQLIGTVVERKLLYTYVQQDRDFDYDRPSRYATCLEEWQASVREQATAVQGKGKERLKARLCERSILDQYMRERLFAGLRVEDAEVVEYYKNHAAEFKEPEKVELRQVLLANEAEARRWRAQINAHNFAEIARAHSIAPEASAGGRLGPFARGALPAVFDVAFHMRQGEISDVLKSNYGYHIIMLVGHTPKTELGLEAARPRIVARLRRRKEDEAYGKWVEKALAAINVSSPKTAL